ncbi:MAG: DUF721 domain-containing protein [Pseudomonadota bacterium]
MTDTPVNTRATRKPPPRLHVAMGREVGRLAAASGAMDPKLAEAWTEIVGPTLAPLCRPVRLKKRGKSQTLVVSVPTGAAAMRVQFSQKEILTRASTYLRLPTLKALSIEQAGAQTAAPKKGRAGLRNSTKQWKSAALATNAKASPIAPRPAESVAEALARLQNTLSQQ